MTVAPGKHSANMVDWKYSSFFPLDWVTELISRRPSSWNRVQRYGQIERFDRNAGPDSSGLISMEHTVPSCAEKGGTQIFHKKSMENLWKSVNNILWTTDDSAIGRIEICGDQDSAIGRKEPKEESWCYGPWIR